MKPAPTHEREYLHDPDPIPNPIVCRRAWRGCASEFGRALLGAPVPGNGRGSCHDYRDLRRLAESPRSGTFSRPLTALRDRPCPIPCRDCVEAVTTRCGPCHVASATRYVPFSSTHTAVAGSRMRSRWAPTRRGCRMDLATAADPAERLARCRVWHHSRGAKGVCRARVANEMRCTSLFRNKNGLNAPKSV